MSGIGTPTRRSGQWILFLWVGALILVLSSSVLIMQMTKGHNPVKRFTTNLWAEYKASMNQFAEYIAARHRAEEYSQAHPAGQGGPASLAELRAIIEKAAASVIHTPELKEPTQQIEIQTPASPLNFTTNEVHQLLAGYHYQYVEAVDPDKIHIVVIVRSKDWPELSGRLQTAAERQGFLYRGPSQTSSSEKAADTMIAEIQIMRKPGK